MSYKVKSLLYLVAFAASAFMYDAMNTDALVQTADEPAKIAEAVSDNSELQAQDEAIHLEDLALKN